MQDCPNNSASYCMFDPILIVTLNRIVEVVRGDDTIGGATGRRFPRYP